MSLGHIGQDGERLLDIDELAAKRVDLAAPEMSLVLTMPSAENPPDRHPNVTYSGPNDRDYQLILVWIREGAKLN